MKHKGKNKMNFKHGYYSTNIEINPDSRLLAGASLTTDDLCIADSFLRGELTPDPIQAHNIVKSIYQAGKLKYPTIWEGARQYIGSYEYDSMERLANLPSREQQRT